MAHYNFPYRMVKTNDPSTAVSANFEDDEALDTLRAQHGNRDLVISVALYETPDPSSKRIYPLCFRFTSRSLEQVRTSALEAASYLVELLGISDTEMVFIFIPANPEDDDRRSHDGRRDGRADIRMITPVEIMILVPPAVFGSSPTPYTPLLNYDLARQMRDHGMENLDIDCYVRDHFVPLPDSISGATGRFIVRVSPRELLYLSPRGIFDLSRQPRGDDCLAAGHLVPEAAEWFAEALAEKEKHVRRQSQLREHLLRLGWAVLPCIRRLDWAEMSDESALEACRIIAGFYPFIGAGANEVWYHIHRIDQRQGLQQGARLRAIVTFGNENPAFVGCEHPLLRQFCPVGGCFMKELTDDLQSPWLFT